MVQKEELDLHASKDDFEYYVKLGTLIKNSIKETCMDSTVEGTNGVLKERNHVILKIISYRPIYIGSLQNGLENIFVQIWAP